jgi:hypothetical protein
MVTLDWVHLEGPVHKHRFKFLRREVRTVGVLDSCWTPHYEVYIFECTDMFCRQQWPVVVEDYWNRKIFSSETTD